MCRFSSLRSLDGTNAITRALYAYPLLSVCALLHSQDTSIQQRQIHTQIPYCVFKILVTSYKFSVGTSQIAEAAVIA